MGHPLFTRGSSDLLYLLPPGHDPIAQDKRSVALLDASYLVLQTITLGLPLLIALSDSASYLTQPSVDIERSTFALLDYMLLESRPSCFNDARQTTWSSNRDFCLQFLEEYQPARYFYESSALFSSVLRAE